MKETIIGGDKQHLRSLCSLRNNYLLPICRIDNLDPDFDIVSNALRENMYAKQEFKIN